MSLRTLSRVENTSIEPKVFKILIGCSARECNTPTKNGSHDRYKGKRKCSRCPAADLYITIGSRYRGKPIKKVKYTQDNYEKLFNSILDRLTEYFEKYGRSVMRGAILQELLNEAYKEGQASVSQEEKVEL